MNLIKLSILCIGFYWGLNSLAEISSSRNLNFINASRVILPTVTSTSTDSTTSDNQKATSNPFVYGGVAGPFDAASCIPNADATCNNCRGDNKPCNTNRILPSSNLRIEFQTDNKDVAVGTAAVFLLVDQNRISNVPDMRSEILAANTPLYAEFRWSEICSAVGAGPDCSTLVDLPKSFSLSISADGSDTPLASEKLTFQVYIAGPSIGTTDYANFQYTTRCPPGVALADTFAGYCWFQVERGDQKVYITEDAQIKDFPRAPGGVKYSSLRIYYAPGDMTCNEASSFSIVNSASNYKDFTFSEGEDSKYSLDSNTITGLMNGKRYYFRFANVDEAGNVFYFSGDSTATPANKQILTCDLHAKVPAEVVGLLDGKECFIATAAFGSPMAPQLDILRSFRDKFLITNSIGRWFVTKYYTYSPKWAQKIKKNETARAVVRATLSPVITMAQWIIFYGLKSFILLSALGFVLGFLVVRRLIQDND